MERRRFLSALPAFALLPLLPSVPSLGSGRAARRAVALSGFNHVELAVSNLDRSIRFYQEVFGTPIQSRTATSAVLRLGRAPRYLAIRQVAAGAAPAISRLGLAVGTFDPAAIVRELAPFGVTDAGQGRPADIRRRVWREPSGGLFMGDPHGILVQLVDRTHCGGTGPLGNQCGTAQPSPTPGSLSLLELNHFTVSVSDPNIANTFWQETFGAAIQAYQAASPTLDVDMGGPEFVMFIGGGGGGRGAGAAAAAPAAPPAPPPPLSGGVHHVCFTIPNFNVENTFQALARHGIERRDGAGGGPMTSYVTLRMPNRGGAEGGTPEFYFLDPDGLLIQLQDATYCGGAGYLGEVC